MPPNKEFGGIVLFSIRRRLYQAKTEWSIDPSGTT
jgi:hypothetical protein